ncbi:uncharacterized protein METZ01_LOCUS413507, partial [marine metagenome]
LPKVDDFTPAFWRRIRVIPFNRKFEGKNRDPNIIHKLKEESSGILNCIIQGFRDWTEQELSNPPNQVKQATDSYRNESDIVAQFVADCVTVVGGYEVSMSAKLIYERYKGWHKANEDGNPLSIQAFGKRMNQLGYKSKKIGGVKKYLGLETGL